MVKYYFKLNNYQIINTRSRINDTIVIEMRVKINNVIVQKITIHDGDRNNGTYNINRTIEFDLENDDEYVEMEFLIQNKGHGDTAETEQILNALSGAIGIGGAIAGATIVAAPIGLIAGIVSGVLTILSAVLDPGLFFNPNCDGTTVVDKFAGTHQDIAEYLFNNTTNGLITFNKIYDGYDSPHGCGSNSIYKVNITYGFI